MGDPERAAKLLDLVLRHANTIKVAVDQLAQIEAKAELHVIAVRLLELAFRSEPASKKRDMSDVP
jgi:hypothetical protein